MPETPNAKCQTVSMRHTSDNDRNVHDDQHAQDTKPTQGIPVGSDWAMWDRPSAHGHGKICSRDVCACVG
eukprot:6136622-Pyramimonas_sp.AAC.1